MPSHTYTEARTGGGERESKITLNSQKDFLLTGARAFADNNASEPARKSHTHKLGGQPRGGGGLADAAFLFLPTTALWLRCRRNALRIYTTT